ncbi:hypothetical protein F2P81_020704 [Scophthalmus maximus]|uniref:Uncharacterized protein n=1 Tax=Scophthalmus maximus TaxID=52904 RepID=A0A6A4S0R0_SCOMX|nr:hypothetical protein F2P81_020704 [Scophthalmus maximus]
MDSFPPRVERTLGGVVPNKSQRTLSNLQGDALGKARRVNTCRPRQRVSLWEINLDLFREIMRHNDGYSVAMVAFQYAGAFPPSGCQRAQSFDLGKIKRINVRHKQDGAGADAASAVTWASYQTAEVNRERRRKASPLLPGPHRLTLLNPLTHNLVSGSPRYVLLGDLCKRSEVFVFLLPSTSCETSPGKQSVLDPKREPRSMLPAEFTTDWHSRVVPSQLAAAPGLDV